MKMQPSLGEGGGGCCTQILQRPWMNIFEELCDQVPENNKGLTVEYHADAKCEIPLKNSENIACVGQRLLNPIMEKNNT